MIGRSVSQLRRDRGEHRLHLRRQAGQDVDVADDEPGCAAERVLERARSRGEVRPAGRVLRVGGEARAQARGEIDDLVLRRFEGGGDRLAGDVVGRAAEAAGDEHDVGAVGLGADELGDAVDLVRAATPSA